MSQYECWVRAQNEQDEQRKGEKRRKDWRLIGGKRVAELLGNSIVGIII